MEVLIILVPLALALGAAGLAGFLWSLKNGQYDDLDGAAWRAILDEDSPGSSDGEQNDQKCDRDPGPGQHQRPVDALVSRTGP
jgi:cbb3-type cytochrome oxidase maturation protein